MKIGNTTTFMGMVGYVLPSYMAAAKASLRPHKPSGKVNKDPSFTVCPKPFEKPVVSTSNKTTEVVREGNVVQVRFGKEE